MLFCWRWNGGTIFLNMGVIRDMSVKTHRPHESDGLHARSLGDAF